MSVYYLSERMNNIAYQPLPYFIIFCPLYVAVLSDIRVSFFLL